MCARRMATLDTRHSYIISKYCSVTVAVLMWVVKVVKVVEVVMVGVVMVGVVVVVMVADNTVDTRHFYVL